MTDPVQCEFVSWNRCAGLGLRLARRIMASGYRPTLIVAVGRGGWMPARVLSDRLGQVNLASVKIEHYRAARKGPETIVRYPLPAPVNGERILLVDDVSDSGDTLEVALAHLRGRGAPQSVRTAVLHHKSVSRHTPDYFAARVVKWRWIIYPWAATEDLVSLLRAAGADPGDPARAGEILRRRHGLRIPRALLAETLTALREEVWK